MTEGRAFDTAAAIDIEAGTVGTADDPGPVRIQVRVFSPRERRALMRASVSVGVQQVATPNNKKCIAALAKRIEAARRAIGQLIKKTKA
jgi:hypothetical protein